MPLRNRGRYGTNVTPGTDCSTTTHDTRNILVLGSSTYLESRTTNGKGSGESVWAGSEGHDPPITTAYVAHTGTQCNLASSRFPTQQTQSTRLSDARQPTGCQSYRQAGDGRQRESMRTVGNPHPLRDEFDKGFH